MGLGTVGGNGRVWRCVVGGRWWGASIDKAAGVQAEAASGPNHQDLLGVVVESGDSGRHADSEG